MPRPRPGAFLLRLPAFQDELVRLKTDRRVEHDLRVIDGAIVQDIALSCENESHARSSVITVSKKYPRRPPVWPIRQDLEAVAQMETESLR